MVMLEKMPAPKKIIGSRSGDEKVQGAKKRKGGVGIRKPRTAIGVKMNRGAGVGGRRLGRPSPRWGQQPASDPLVPST